MKKFLSMVLALVMTMSLAAVSAGATEYKDLTDRDEIQYEEAVAVLNRIGIITGYDDGSFRPETELTRGAAAKIIVSLMIGPEAASNLPNSSSPYPDVPAGHTFAGVISYCKTAGYISGYGDGTFKPANSLTGFAFAKMLLGALGYKSELEGFTGSGWTMNVARIGNAAGLFNRLSFQGADAVTREEACQLALNTLKATLVEYTGGFNITAGDASISGAQTRTYVTSNQEYAKHISNKKSGNSGNATDNHWTVEFGEEHFKDLRMNEERTNVDAYGRPSNVWSYKLVTIGTFPVAPNFTYTTQAAHNVEVVSDGSKVRALGLSGYEVDDEATALYVNGELIENAFDGAKEKVATISDYTDNGTLVELYVDDEDADLISHVVVIKTQMMSVKRVAGDYVALDRVSPTNKSAVPNSGYNQAPIHVEVEDVEEENAYYSLLSDLKAGDLVAVVPVDADHDGDGFEVGKAYVPEEVSGQLTRVSTYGNTESERQAIDVTVGGTAYKVALWNKDLAGIKADDIKVTRENVKLYLDEYGYALRAKGVGDTTDFMIIKGYYDGLVNNKITHFVDGWDVKGNEISLNIGTNKTVYDRYFRDMKPGDLVKYTNEGAVGSADWTLLDGSAADVYDIDTTGTGHADGLKASNVRVKLSGLTDRKYITEGIKFIYVTFDEDGDVESVEVRDRVQTVEKSALDFKAAAANSNPAEACLNSDGEVEAIVVKQESNDAISSNLLYIRNFEGVDGIDENGSRIYQYTVAMMTADGLEENVKIWSDKSLRQGDFASYALKTKEGYEPFYSLKQHTATQKTTSVNTATVFDIVNADKSLVKLTGYGTTPTDISNNWSADLGVGDESNVVDMSRAKWLDLRYRGGVDSVSDLKEMITDENRYATLKMIYNDNVNSDGFRMVSLVIITGSQLGQPNAPAENLNTDAGWKLYLGDQLVTDSDSYAAPVDITLDQTEQQQNFRVEANSPYATVTSDTGVVDQLAFIGAHTWTVTAQDGSTTNTFTVNVADRPLSTQYRWVVASIAPIANMTGNSNSVNFVVMAQHQVSNDSGATWNKVDDRYLTATEIEDLLDIQTDGTKLTITPAGQAAVDYAPTQDAQIRPAKGNLIPADLADCDAAQQALWNADAGYVTFRFVDKADDTLPAISAANGVTAGGTNVTITVGGLLGTNGSALPATQVEIG